MRIKPIIYEDKIKKLLSELQIDANKDYQIEFIKHNENHFKIVRNNNHFLVYFQSENQIYASLLTILHRNDINQYEEIFKPTFKNTGLMLDVARNAVLNKKTIKKYIMLLALLGYNYLEIYFEDLIEVDDEPKFGYLRGKYSQKELKELDDFAYSYGIELVPAIQTLAYLNQIFRHREYREILDINDILLAENERTYLLIENMFKTISKTFRTKHVNIGMDEAWALGVGNYLKINGYKNRVDIMKTHLKKVNQLCKKYHLKPKMWADMFFNLTGANYHHQVDMIPKEIIDIVPKDIELVFWEYFHKNKEYYDLKYKNIKQMTDNYSFAGGAIKWIGFAPHNRCTITVLREAFKSAKENNVENFLITAWGDHGAEASHFSILPSLIYMQHLNYNKDILEYYSKLITNYAFDELLELDSLNILYDHQNYVPTNPNKYLLYEDLLLGDLDQTPNLDYNNYYLKYYNTLKNLSTRRSPYRYLFNTLASLANILKDKASLSVMIYHSYHKKDKTALKEYALKIEEIIKNVKQFIEVFETQWHEENKPHGFEIQSYRLGGLIERLKYIIRRLNAYLSNEIDNIPELD
ncbi:MAG: family 20 glycosylhydrolase, partial [Acholeplasmataceae bacterium]